MEIRQQLNSRFAASLAQVDELLAIFRYIHANSEIPAKDNILRAALTMLVSTIDTTVHELVIGTVIQELENPSTSPRINRQKVGIHCILESDPSLRLTIVEADLRMQYSKETFQSSNQIESALSGVGINKIWTRLSTRLNCSPEDIKLRLNLMVRRRNQIVHEADLDAYHNTHAISLAMLEELYLFTVRFVNAMLDEYTNFFDDYSG